MPPEQNGEPRIRHELPVTYAAVFVVGVLVGAFGGMQYQQMRDDIVLNDTLTEKDAAITQLQEALTEAMVRTTINETPTPAVKDDVSDAMPTPAPAPISLTLPQQGARLCRNTFLTIAWQGDPNTIDELRIWLDNTMVPTGPLYQGPLLHNEQGTPGEGATAWLVGTAPMGASFMNVPDGQLYRIKYEALYQGRVIHTNTSGTFAIQTCEG